MKACLCRQLLGRQESQTVGVIWVFFPLIKCEGTDEINFLFFVLEKRLS